MAGKDGGPQLLASAHACSTSATAELHPKATVQLRLINSWGSDALTFPQYQRQNSPVCVEPVQRLRISRWNEAKPGRL